MENLIKREARRAKVELTNELKGVLLRSDLEELTIAESEAGMEIDGTVEHFIRLAVDGFRAGKDEETVLNYLNEAARVEIAKAEHDKHYQEMHNEFDGVLFNKTDLALTQQPYIDGKLDETPIYRAGAVDREGNRYAVVWAVKENWEQIEDEQEMCDWDNPIEITEL